MSLVFRVVLIVVSLLVLLYVLKRIRHAKVQIEDAIFWIVFSLLLLGLSVVPQVADMCAKLLGIYSTVNFIFLFFIFILILKLFTMTIKISQLDARVKELTQQIAIKETADKNSGKK